MLLVKVWYFSTCVTSQSPKHCTENGVADEDLQNLALLLGREELAGAAAGTARLLHLLDHRPHAHHAHLRDTSQLHRKPEVP